MKGLSAVGLGAAVGVRPFFAAEPAEPAYSRRRYAIIGTGSRHEVYQDAIERDYAKWAELVALCDRNPGRVDVARARSAKNGAESPPGYVSQDFEKMIVETKPDVVIVTTMDATHHDYIVRAMELGCDVITEKPLTTTSETCRRIIEARHRTGKQCRVAFNYRYSPVRTQVKDVLMSGEIGDVLSVDFHWLLDTQHGADYFRRWHSNKKNSGGLIVHKASHHFDLVNWWLAAMPVSVMATGKREFYTPAMAKRLGLENAHDRCRTCAEKDKCSFFLDLAADPEQKSLYLDQEQYDGYFRDRCVWRPDIDIEDTMNVLVRYDNGVTLSYSLNAFSAWEGYTIAFNGTKGRLEHTLVEPPRRGGPSAAPTPPGQVGSGPVTLRVVPLRGQARELTPWAGQGGHDGGDKPMLDDIFQPDMPADKYLRAADERAGACSMLVGVAANRCFETGHSVAIADLVPGLVRPDYAPMPLRDGPLPMPPRVST